ncbi:MAG TPA: CBS domain-containing protein [Vicinamibacteria bacterium]|nr:CBS domain-containing protein [Vicinamibacteria bacterium]
MVVGDYMTKAPITVGEDTSMKEAVELLRQHHIRHLPVVLGHFLVGIVSDRDIRKASPSLLSGVDMTEYEDVLRNTPISRVMTREPFTVTAETDLREAVQLLVDKKIGAIPVVDGKELVGIFSEIDALKVLLGVLSQVPQRL